ncbi:tyrosine-type recombinase/integrase [Idiomarina loihiensis]|uniref:tyrosine-type recombinase/integrase n=1 Tax=Idiomarina loihiensis TaxID=135577 RepID=UPI00315952C2
MAIYFTVNYIKGLKAKVNQYELFENTERRGAGRLGVRVLRSSGKMFIFRYFFEGRRQYITLGKFGDTPSSLSLMDARLKAEELSEVVLNGEDPKQLIQKRKDAQELHTRQMSTRGTLKQLLDSYVHHMKETDKRTFNEVRAALYKEVLSKIDNSSPASEVETSSFVRILAEMIDRGATTQSNRVRSYLHAAYQFGMKLDNNPRHTRYGLKFNILHNPITAIPRQADAERALTRYLTFEELEYFFSTLPQVKKVGSQTVLILKLCIFLGGQRPFEVLGTPWSSIDLERKEFLIPAQVSKNKKQHLVPLSDSAVSILLSLKRLNPDSQYPTSSSSSKLKPLKSSSLSRAVIRFRNDHTDFLSFTPRDLRRTCKTMMGTLGISKLDRDKLQNHTINDISSKHYDHYDYYQEKKMAIEIWDRKIKEFISL